MISKEQRQKRIQEIIAKESVSTQAELVDRLRGEGVRVTQATVSRDINELRLVRLPIGKSKHRYSLAQVQTESDVLDELGRLFRNFVTDVDRGENLLIVKTAEGHATGVAYIIDKLRRDDIVGTLAGQDTILLVARTVEEGEALLEELHGLMLS
ncbi:arginine repressor [Deinococcus peraridilitoris]|uniref:Arginine repressor n=1 Tax=Deinococcus peraridilitoris (strain DSM 19664 / LMG 22246 / CIP 109416 / KR-200) TaxID=937777 RepID=L0A1A6_DEIPD|nr:arginine repressor [Deinococcus peraridilitoris]AFZ66800.1 arginine repressor [Deinococcus peraridilitoris DSM 19664]